LSTRLTRSAPGRVLMFCLAFSLLTVVPVLLFIYEQTDRLFENRIVDRIDDRERDLLLGYRSGGLPGLVRSIDREVDSGVLRGGAVLLADSSGRKIAGNLASWPGALGGPTRWTTMRLYPQDAARSEEFALRVIALPTGHRLLLGTNVEARERMRASLFEALLGALALAIPLALVASALVLRITNRQVSALGKVATRIAAGDLTQRVDASGEGQPFEQVAMVINTMLARIEELVGQLRLVTDALAHDLRSPLTRMRAHLENAATQSSEDVRGHSLEGISSEIDGMLRLISSTLEIGRTEAGLGRENFVDFDLGALLHDLCEMYHPLAEDRDVSLAVDNPRPIAFFGNRELLGQAVSNLIDNALKYSGADRLRVGADETGRTIRLWVADDGRGIPAERRADALRKYSRLEEARTTDGSGLGLALVRAVARLHGGELALEENAPGLRAVIALPRHPA
jgi:signal transduction histidine kinase